MQTKAPARVRAAVWGTVCALAATAAWLLVDSAYVESRRDATVESWRLRLSALADERARAVADTVQDLTDRAALVGAFPAVRAYVGAPADAGGGERAERAAVEADLGSVMRIFPSEGIWVVGPRRAVAAGDLARVAEAGRLVREVADDVVRRSAPQVEVRTLDGVAMVVAGTPCPGPDGAPCGGAIVRIDSAARALFPSVGPVATGGTSLEAILVRRNGDDVQFLTPLAHPEALGGADGVPFATAPQPSRLALTIASGFGDYHDYRGVPVLAASRHVAGAPWGIVVKVDEDEALAEYRGEMRRSAMVGLAILLGVLGIAYSIRRSSLAAAAAALARSEARFASLIEDANDPILVLAHDGSILRANRRAESFYGRSAAELLAMTASELRPPENRADTDRDRDRAAATGGLVFETEHMRADGVRLPVEVSVRPLDLDGRRVYVSIVRDVTERRAAETALRGSEQRERARASELEVVLDALPIGVVITRDAGCRDVRGNRIAHTLLGLAPESDLTMPEDGTTPFRAAADGRPLRSSELPLDVAATQGADVEGYEMDVVRPDGTLRRLLVNAQPLRGADGAVRGAVAGFVDVTDQRLMQREVGVLWRAIEQAPVSVVITDRDGNIEYVNPAFCTVTGYASSEVAGKNPRLLQSGTTPREEYAALWARITSGGTWAGEFQNRRKDGSLYWESAVISPVLDRSDRTTHYVAVKEDITARKTQEAALRAIQGELLQSQKMEAVGRLAGGVAHDFNNLLSVIMGYTEMTLEQFGRDDPRRRGLEDVRDAAERASGLTRQLLAFSRKQVVEPRVLDLGAVVAGVSKMLARLVGEDVALDVRSGAGDARVLADVGQIEQVLMNLVVNARDAMPHGGRVEIATRVDVVPPGAEPRPGLGAGRWVVLSVRDTGVGIPAANRDKIFEPFFTTKEAGKGTGLGLPTVYGIVRQAGGLVRFESEVGRGTVFEVVLPCFEGRAGGARPAPESVDAQGSGTILLVEDEPSVRELARVLLTEHGYAVLDAENANAALGIAATHDGPIDLLLTDVVMPGAPGPDLAGILAGRIAGRRVLYMSGYTEHPMLRSAELLAGTRLLRKPFTGEVLRRAVASALLN